jgi:Predicted NADH:ubiquinone oxidoreductase, subunit RnfD
MRGPKLLAMGEAPFAFAPRTNASLMWGTVAALLPALAWGLYCFGPVAGLPILASIAGAIAGEALASGLRRRFTLWDGSAFLTGLLVGMAMPPGISPFIPAITSFFAVSVIKGAFGGLGSNWMNPALAGIAFALINWPKEMNAWSPTVNASGIAGLSGATPLGFARAHAAQAAAGSSPMDALASGGARFSAFDGTVTDSLNNAIFSRLGADLPGGYIDLLVGNKPGAIGEISAILILLGSVILLSRRMIRWEIPASIVVSFSLFTWAFGGLSAGNGLFTGDVLFASLSGSFLLVAFFMATDPVTSPSSRWGMLGYGLGIGALTFLMRGFGASTEGSAFAVIIMDCAVPALEGMGLDARTRRAAKARSSKAAAKTEERRPSSGKREGGGKGR